MLLGVRIIQKEKENKSIGVHRRCPKPGKEFWMLITTATHPLELLANVSKRTKERQLSAPILPVKKYIYIKIIIIKKMGGKWKERKKEKSLHRVPEVISALINHAHFPLI